MSRRTREEVDAALDPDSIKYEDLLDNNNVLQAEVRALREELTEVRRDAREPGCQCTSEIGDSPCPAHPLNPATELPYTSREAGELATQLTELREAALDLACEHMGMDSNEELLLWLETLPATDPGHSTPWGRFFAVLAKVKP